MRGVASVACLLLIVLAGCNGVVGGGGDDAGDGEDARTPTVTPAPVPETEPSATPEPRLAPGLTTKGVTNASALAAAHDAVLENASFTVRRTVIYRTDDGTPIRRIESVSRVGRDGRVRITRRWNGTDTLQRKEYYGDGQRLLVATTDTNDTTTYRRTQSESVAGQPTIAGTGSEQIEGTFIAARTRVVGRVEQGERTVYRLGPERGPNGSVVSAVDPLGRSAVARARVTDRGLVRAYTLRQTLSEDSGDAEGTEDTDDAAVIVVSARYTDIGATMVERPTWYERALAETNATERT